MTYVFDCVSLSNLKHYPQTVFEKMWENLDLLFKEKLLLSTREVWNEIERGSPVPFVNGWLKERKEMFTTPTAEEQAFVSQIFLIEHFRALVSAASILKGVPAADPFVIARAKVCNGTVVTEERLKPNAAKIPNVCAHFNVPCVNLTGFMEQQKWKF